MFVILGFLVFFFIWSILEVLIIVEFVIVFFENGGYVLWILVVFGEFWGF